MENEQRTAFGKRLLEAREAAGFTQAQVAEKIGMSQGTLGEAEKDGKRSGYTAQLARLYGVDADWLATGRGKPKPRQDVSLGPDIRGRVPLISWVIAGDLCEPREIIDPAEATEWFDCPVKHGPRTFCLIVDSVSMDDGTSDGYREGEIIFVDPDVAPTPGKDVVVRSGNKTTFKRLKEDGDGRYLLALNGKKIVPVPEGTEYCGVVIFSGVRR